MTADEDLEMASTMLVMAVGFTSLLVAAVCGIIGGAVWAAMAAR